MGGTLGRFFRWTPLYTLGLWTAGPTWAEQRYISYPVAGAAPCVMGAACRDRVCQSCGHAREVDDYSSSQ